MNILSFPLRAGPKNIKADLIVVHAMAEYILCEGKYIHAFDYLKKAGLSAHALVTPRGDILKCRQYWQGAWHALGYNYNSLGVEFLVPGRHSYPDFLETIKRPYLTSIQYEEGIGFINRELIGGRGINRILRHSDVSPERKVDPGMGFPWKKFVKALRLAS